MRLAQTITSRTNPKVKELLELKNSKEYLFVEGYRIIDEILNANITPEQVICTPEAESNPITLKAFSKMYNITSMNSQVFKKFSETEAPQGLAAFFKKPSYNINELLQKSGKKSVFLLLHEVQDPGNLGTIFRTARAAGVSGIIITKKSVSVANSKVVRSSMGTVFSVPFTENVELVEAISYLKNKSISIAATDAKNGENVFTSEYKLPVCFVFGSEAHGLPAEVIKKADVNIQIPILAQIESLNLSVSAAILMYDAVKRFSLYRK